MARKAVHHVLFFGVEDILQGAFGVVGSSRQTVSHPGGLTRTLRKIDV